MNNFVIFFWVCVRILSSLKWFDIWYDCLLFYNREDSTNCLTQNSVGLKKELRKYTHSDIPQLCKEITERYSKLLGPLPLTLLPIHEVSQKIPLINESKQLKHRLPKCPEAFCSELAWKIKWYTTAGGGYQQLRSKQHLCCVYQRKMVHCEPYSICNSRRKYMERCNTFPRSRCDMSWYSAS